MDGLTGKNVLDPRPTLTPVCVHLYVCVHVYYVSVCVWGGCLCVPVCMHRCTWVFVYTVLFVGGCVCVRVCMHVHVMCVCVFCLHALVGMRGGGGHQAAHRVRYQGRTRVSPDGKRGAQLRPA